MLERLFNWKWVLALLLPISYLIILSMKHVDHRVAFWTEELSPSIKSFFTAITHLGLGYLFIILFLIILAGQHLIHQHEGLKRRLIFSITSLILVMGLIYPLKVSFGRMRPGPLLGQGLHGFEPFSRFDLAGSFPSGHSADIAALCLSMCLWWKNPAWRGVLLCVILLIAASRVMIAWHFVSDVIAGVFVGFIAVYLTQLLIKKPLDLDENK